MSEGGASSRSPRLQGLLVILLTLIVGGVIGATVERVRASNDRPDRRFARERPRGDRPLERDRLPRPFDEIALTDAQREQIQAVFEQIQPRTDSVMETMWPALHAIRESVQVQIDSILTPEQRGRLSREFGDFWRRGPGFPGDFRRGRAPPRFRRDSGENRRR